MKGASSSGWKRSRGRSAICSDWLSRKASARGRPSSSLTRISFQYSDGTKKSSPVGAVVVGEDRAVEDREAAAEAPGQLGHAVLQVAPEQKAAPVGEARLVEHLVLRRAVREMEGVVVGELGFVGVHAPGGVRPSDEVAAVQWVVAVVLLPGLQSHGEAGVEEPAVALLPLVLEGRVAADVDRGAVGQPPPRVHEQAGMVVVEHRPAVAEAAQPGHGDRRRGVAAEPGNPGTRDRSRAASHSRDR